MRESVAASMRRSLVAILLAVASVLAGCASPAADVDPADVGETSGALSFGAPVAMAQPSFGAEPNIAVAPDGTLWITAVAGSQDRPNAVEGAAWLWRSTDGGATWETIREPTRETPLGSVSMTRKPFGSSDADVVTSPDGWVYYSDWWNWGAPAGVPNVPVGRYGSYLVERSSDGGATWESAPVTTLDSVGGIDRQWLVAGEDGFLALFYAYFHGPNPTRGADGVPTGVSSIQAVYSADHGASWSQPRTVVESPAGEFAQIAHPWLTSDGVLWMPHAWTKETDTYWTDPSEARVAVSHDLGATWEVHKIADVPEGFDNLWAIQGASDEAGRMHAAWSARTGENMTTFYAVSEDDGVTWSEPLALRAAGLNFLPWVAARGDGDVAVGWYGSDATGVAVEAPDDTEWFAYVAHKPEGADAFTLLPVQAEPVKVGPMCAKGASCPGDRELLDYFSLAFDAAGALHVAFATSQEQGGSKVGLVSYARSASATAGVESATPPST